MPEIPFDSAPCLKLPPDLNLGEAAGVAVKSKGHVFVFSRGNSTGPAYGATVTQLLEFGRRLKQFGWIHEMACPSENVLYVAEILNWRVQKLT